ncbi:hypothetical protein KAW80_01300 [Candidatus Babeliales bacterium]|nr:hypothetical protein [Candidatus Babeliales bacterium]
MSDKVKADLEKLIGQTSFLLEKQKASKEYCGKQFAELIGLIDSKAKNLDVANDKATVDKLTEISEIIGKHLINFEEEVEQDISFLEDQLKAIQEIKDHHDPESAAKLITVLMDGQTILDTKVFKDQIEEEAKASQESFSTVINDLKSAINEDGVDELLVYLKELEEEDRKEKAEEQFEVSFDPEEEAEEKKESCCKGDDENCECSDDDDCCDS